MRHFDQCVDDTLLTGFSGRFCDLGAFVDRAIRRHHDLVGAARTIQSAVITVLGGDLWYPRYGGATEDPRVLETVSFLDPGMSPLSVNLLWTVAAYRRTNRCYRVTPSLGQRLCHTELRGIHAGDLRLPYPAIYIEIPREAGLRIWNTESGWHRLIGCYVVQEPEPERRWWIMCWGESKGELAPGVIDDALVYWAMRLLDDRWTVDQIIADTANPKPQDLQATDWARRYQHFSTQPWPDIFRWVMNLIIYVTSSDARISLDPGSEKAYRERQHGKTAEKRRAAEYRWRRLGHTMIVGQGVEPLARHDLTVRTLVTGHWRHVAYGTQGQDRKLMWIQPYWRGPVDAPISQTQHAV